MSSASQLVFCLAAAVALASALGTVLFRNPLHSALALLAHIVALAGIYVGLHAHLLAAIQLIVYAGAVVVLFVFVIMLIGPSADPAKQDRSENLDDYPDAAGVTAPSDEAWEHFTHGHHGLVSRTLGATVLVLFCSALAVVAFGHHAELPILRDCEDRLQAECQQFGGVEGLGREVYQVGVVPFELVSVLLLVAIVGAMAVARGRQKKSAPKQRRVGQEPASHPQAGSASSAGSVGTI